MNNCTFSYFLYSLHLSFQLHYDKAAHNDIMSAFLFNSFILSTMKVFPLKKNMTTPTFSTTNIKYVVDIILVQPSLISWTSGLD